MCLRCGYDSGGGLCGGCNGNTQGVAKLADGRDAKELVETLEGIKCSFKGTSCPDQLAKAIKEVL